MAKAKKGATSVDAKKTAKPRAVRLDLQPADYEKLERLAESVGLTLSSYARMTMVKHLRSQEVGKE